MAFSISPAFTHVPIEEPHLHEVFRSISTSVVKMTGGRLCEAFICTSRKSGRYAVFVSLLDTVTRIIHVMTPEEQDVTAEMYRNLLDEARTLLTDLGFELEKVNIEFSAAIREVVIRDIRVMHPPPRNRMRISRGQNRHTAEDNLPTAGAASTAAGAAAGATVAAEAIAVAAEKVAPVEPDVATLRDEICRLRRDGLHLQKMLKKASAELEKLRTAKTQSEEELLEVRDALSREMVAASRVSAEATAVEAALSEKIRLLEEDLAAAKMAPDYAEKPSADPEVERLQSEIESLMARHREETEQHAAERREAVREAEELQQKLSEIEERHREEQRVSERAAETIARLEEELTAAKREAETPQAEVYMPEIDRLKAEIECLKTQKEALERFEAEQTDVVGEAELLRRELLELQEKYLADTAAMRTLEEEGELARAAAAKERDALLRRHEEELEEQRALLLAGGEEIRALRDELLRVQSERKSEGEESSGLTAAAKTARLAAEAEAARLQEEVRRLREEQEAEALATDVEMEMLRRKGTEAEQTLVHLQEEHRRLTVERPTLLAAARKAKRLQTEIQRLKADHAEREAALVAELQQRVVTSPKAAPEEVVAVREESPLPVPVMTIPDNHLPIEHDMADSLALLLADGAGYAPATFGSAAVAFRVDPRLHDVEYESDDDVLAVYEAMNNVQAMPDGRGLKKCGAYICVVRRDGKPQVHNVWILVDQGTALVAVPDRQEGESGAESVLKDALFYFESVGFIMEPLDLGNSRQKRSRALSRVSVLRKNEAAVAAKEASVLEHAHASR